MRSIVDPAAKGKFALIFPEKLLREHLLQMRDSQNVIRVDTF